MRAADQPLVFDLPLPPLTLECGARVEPHVTRGFWWGPQRDLEVLAALVEPLPAESLRAAPRVVRRDPGQLRAPRARWALEPRPTVLLVHALTGDARAGGEQGWWGPLLGPGRALDPSRHRILCFNNLGGCYGASGPLTPGFPVGSALTTVDQARALWQALDALGVTSLHLAAGGSLGGMILLCLAALRPYSVRRLFPVGTTAFASAWMVGFNHVQRQILRLDTARGLEVARQLAMLTYRAEPGLEARQPRHRPPEDPRFRHAIESYLEHQGEKLHERFDAAAYLALLGAMDAHDLLGGSARLSTIRSSALVADIDTDQLYTPAEVERLARLLGEAGNHVERATLRSPHGHDAFLIEWEAMGELLRRALDLPEPPAP